MAGPTIPADLDLAISSLRVVLTPTEALEWAADLLTQNATGLKLSAMVVGKMTREAVDQLSDEDRKRLERVKAHMVEPDLQVAAMQAAAASIRAMALEERIVAARVRAKAGSDR